MCQEFYDEYLDDRDVFEYLEEIRDVLSFLQASIQEIKIKLEEKI